MHVIWLVYLFIIKVSSTIFNCSSVSGGCANQHYICGDGEDCFIYCMEPSSCYGSKFTCPRSIDSDQSVSCEAVCGMEQGNSCQYVTFDAYYSDTFSLKKESPIFSSSSLTTPLGIVSCPYNGSCHIDCGYGKKACSGMTINGYKGTLDIYNHGSNSGGSGMNIQAGQSTLSITAHGPDYSFYRAIINASQASAVSITGGGSYEFDSANIYASQVAKSRITADGSSAFYRANIYASEAKEINLTATGWRALDYTNIYCPNRGNNDNKLCHINYISYGGTSASRQTTIYAINGFLDVDIVCKNHSVSQGIGCIPAEWSDSPTIRCLADYTNWCRIITSDGIHWSCRGVATCESVTPSTINSITTQSPTSYPSTPLTVSPTGSTISHQHTAANVKSSSISQTAANVKSSSISQTASDASIYYDVIIVLLSILIILMMVMIGFIYQVYNNRIVAKQSFLTSMQHHALEMEEHHTTN